MAVFAPYDKQTLIAHRGASGYAPEHTLEAYRLAIEQGAHYVEQDLQMSKEGVLVCLHDLSLERTTNVQERFPDRYRDVQIGGVTERHWFVADFSVEEMKQLDAGSWFDDKFAGAQIPTWQEAIQEIRGKAGLFPEIKTPEIYRDAGFDLEQAVVDELTRNGLDEPGADSNTPVVIQSFSAESLRRMAGELQNRLPLSRCDTAIPSNGKMSLSCSRDTKVFRKLNRDNCWRVIGKATSRLPGEPFSFSPSTRRKVTTAFFWRRPSGLSGFSCRPGSALCVWTVSFIGCPASKNIRKKKGPCWLIPGLPAGTPWNSFTCWAFEDAPRRANASSWCTGRDNRPEATAGRPAEIPNSKSQIPNKFKIQNSNPDLEPGTRAGCPSNRSLGVLQR